MPLPSSERALARDADLAACRAMLRGGSRTFFAASLLLPRAVREPASALYAFCRLSDDAIDLDGGHMDALDRLQLRLERAYAGSPLPEPADRALADVLARFAIPPALPQALLEGLAWDAAGRRYASIAELEAYAVRVAGTVGAMMAIVMGARTPALVARACDLGVAMQLTNIARDVGEDARAGRLYLPLGWLADAGIDAEAWLARPVFDAALGGVVARLLDVADALYARADPGIAGLPAACRPGIHAARHLYAAIGEEVRSRGCDSVAQRAVVPSERKLGLLVRALAAAAVPGRHVPAPPLEQARFLVDAVAAAPALPQAAPEVPWWRIAERAAWVIDLFERLERREQLGRSGGSL